MILVYTRIPKKGIDFLKIFDILFLEQMFGGVTMNNYPKRNILCIDLKSFFASCECIDKGLNPFEYPLVVANPNQGDGAITLAVTPYLKKQGVKSRGRRDY